MDSNASTEAGAGASAQAQAVATPTGADASDVDGVLEQLRRTLPPGASMTLHEYTPELAKKLFSGTPDAAPVLDTTQPSDSAPAAADADAGAGAGAPMSKQEIAELGARIRSVLNPDGLATYTQATPIGDIVQDLAVAFEQLCEVAALVEQQESEVKRNACALSVATFAARAARALMSQFGDATADEVTSDLALMNLIRWWSPRYSDGPFVIKTFSSMLLPSTVQEMDTVMDNGSHEWLMLESARMLANIDACMAESRPALAGAPESVPVDGASGPTAEEIAAIQQMPEDVRKTLRDHLVLISRGELPYCWRRESERDVPQQRYSLARLLDQGSRDHVLGVTEYGYLWLVHTAEKRCAVIERLLESGSGGGSGSGDGIEPKIAQDQRKKLRGQMASLNKVRNGTLPYGHYRIVDRVARSASAPK